LSIPVFNATELFNFGAKIYAFGNSKDAFKLPAPISLTQFGHGVLAFLVSAPVYVPVFFMFGWKFALLSLVLPVALSIWWGKPRFQGLWFTDYAISYVQHLLEPRGWADGSPDTMRPKKYSAWFIILVWRRREIRRLFEIKTGEFTPNTTKTHQPKESW